jgi:anti-sigma factor RsiW
VTQTSAAHDEGFGELAAGYALGALSAEEVAQFRAHLAGCARCRGLVAEYGAVTQALPEALDEMEASERMRGRVLDAVRAELGPIGPENVVELRRPDAAREPGRVAGRRLSTWAIPLAALFVVSLSFGYWASQLQGQLDRQAAQLAAQQRALDAVAAGGRVWTVAAADAASRTSGILVQGPNDLAPYLVLRDLPAASASQDYQAWVIEAGKPTGAGVLGPTGGDVRAARLDRPLGNADTVAVTIEPKGGSQAPTGPIVAVAKL